MKIFITKQLAETGNDLVKKKGFVVTEIFILVFTLCVLYQSGLNY